jgi:hypothetical protein
MFCPKCGGENTDNQTYCRACGDSLILINQVMKGHAPIALMSKIDAVLDTTHELLRRDAILWLIWAVVWSLLILARINWTWIVNQWQALVFVFLFSLIPAGIMFILAGWNFLLFRRAKKLSFRSSAGVSLGHGLPYCPRCGKEQEGRYDFCSECGFDLSVLTESAQRSYLTRELDAALLQKLSISGKTVRSIIFEAVLWSGLGLLTANSLDPINSSFYFLLALSRTVVNIWDLVHFRRKAGSRDSVPTQLLSKPEPDEDVDEKHIRRRKSIHEILILASVLIFVLVFLPVDLLLFGRPKPTWAALIQLTFAVALFFVGWRGQIVQRRSLARIKLEKGLESDGDRKLKSSHLLPDLPDSFITADLSEPSTRKLKR